MKKTDTKLLAVIGIGLVFIGGIFFSCAGTSSISDQVSPDESENAAAVETVIPGAEVPFTITFAEKLQERLENGTIEEALALFNELPPEYEQDLDMQFLRASLLVSAGRLDEAAALTDTLLELAPGNSDVLTLSMMLAKASGDTTKKSALVKELLETDPNNSDANVELAQEQMLRRNYKLASVYYERGLQNNPDHPEALAGYGQALYFIGEDEASRAAFEALLEKDPENSFAYAYLGKLAAVDENYKVATDCIEKALEIDDSVFDYWLDYGQYLRYRGNFAGAEAAWIRAKDLVPDYFLGYAYLAGLYDEQNRFAEALEMYQKVVELNPKYYFAYESLGMFAWHENNFTEARSAFEKAYGINSENVSYPLMIAATYLKEQKQQDARSFLSKAMRNMNTSSVEYAVLRLYYDSINDSQVAQKVLNTSDRNLKGKMLYYLGLFYEINGNDVLAEKYYTDVLSLNSPMFFEYRLAEWALSDNK